jgi:signal recognition particle receptor subunit beta
VPTTAGPCFGPRHETPASPRNTRSLTHPPPPLLSPPHPHPPQTPNPLTDVGGQEKLRPLWRHYFSGTDGLIFVVDSQDRERAPRAAQEFKAIINDPMMRGAAILVFANKQDGPGALTPAEVCECLGLPELRGRRWHVQSAVATRGEGLYEGLDWLSLQVGSSRPA